MDATIEHQTPRRFLRIGQGVAFALLAAFTLNAAFGADHGVVYTIFNSWVYNGLVLLAAASCLTRAVRVPAARAPWLILGAGLLLWAGAEIYNTAFLAELEQPPYPSISDLLWLAFYPASYVAILLLVRGRMRDRRGSLWLDGLVAALAVAAVGEVLVFQPVMQTSGGTALEVATDLAYPIADLLLLSMVVGVFAITGWRPGRAWTLIGAGLAAAVAADCIYAYQAANGTYTEGTMLDAMWPAATLLVGYSAWEPTGKPIDGRPSGWPVLVLPAAFALVALGLLVYDHFGYVDDLAVVMAALTLLAVIVRTAITFGDNLRMLRSSRLEALTDALTGLGNRRSLIADLESRIESSTITRPTALVLFDLDGFKRYNDNFGHPAGDALLARLGSNLELAVRPWGSAYRLGGDEFCALVRVGLHEADEVIGTAAAALVEQGKGFLVGASHGIVFLPNEATESSMAMQIADQRLYGNKGARRRSAVGQQTRDVLLQVLHERQPELHEHMHEVAELALSVGHKMSLLPEELDEMARAAELHDVGKMAIPDEILNKPGALDPVELGFIRQHTIVGERMLAAAPALGSVARLVRASHENWDGSGYPDGIRGEDIPLASRIIAVCDAFHAMTTERPYAAAVSANDAIAELERCAGTHFDPVVVDLLVEELRGDGRGEALPLESRLLMDLPEGPPGSFPQSLA
jgi:diguanylate cyclase (GGDEF)-like protein